ncbi:netrin receptor DCC-like [Ornithodoros turicata]|uniref:netrin receptor DCC-like n=1 Tax=Ornithodoros turicata TaxID=34597 RepID=UPI0031397BFA
MDYSNMFTVAFLIGVHLCFLTSWVSAENPVAPSPSTEDGTRGPGSPGDLNVPNITSTSAALSRTAPQDRNGPIHADFIDMVQESTRFPSGLEVDGKKTKAEFTRLRFLPDLGTPDPIPVEIIPANCCIIDVLISRNGHEIAFTTLPGPPSPPTSLATVVKSRSVTAFWEEPAILNGPEGSLKYKVLIMKDAPFVMPTAELETEDTHIYYDKLQPFTRYFISVSAIMVYQGQAWESESITEVLQTDPEAPSPPWALTTVVKSRSVMAFWEEPAKLNCPKGSLKYKVLIKKDGLFFVRTVELETEDTHIYYDKLQPYTRYVISVSAIMEYQGQAWESRSITKKLQTDPEGASSVKGRRRLLGRASLGIKIIRRLMRLRLG